MASCMDHSPCNPRLCVAGQEEDTGRGVGQEDATELLSISEKSSLGIGAMTSVFILKHLATSTTSYRTSFPGANLYKLSR
jgi:hypothetical protein